MRQEREIEMCYDLDGIKDRLERLGRRCRYDGNYTDAMIAENAQKLICAMEDALHGCVNQIDAIAPYLRESPKRQDGYTPAQLIEMGRAEALGALNFGHAVNSRGECQ